MILARHLALAALPALLVACGGGGESSNTTTGAGGGHSTSSHGGSGGGAGGTATTSSTGTGGAAPAECDAGGYAACASCCEGEHPGGGATFLASLQTCACNFGMCQFKCGALCGGGAVDDACADNAVFVFASPSLGGFNACHADPNCKAYGACLSSCVAGHGIIVDPPPSTSPQDRCVDIINQYRSWESKAALARWTSAEACVDQQIEHDAMTKPHDAFGMCGESTQNECFGFSPEEIGFCQALMYSEKYSGDQGMGHYKAMTGPYTRVACGFSGSSAAQDYQ